MENRAASTTSNNNSVEKMISRVFGAAVLVVGVLTIFWGKEPGLGVFLALLSSLYFIPVNNSVKLATVMSIPMFTIIKLMLGILTTWVVFSQGELSHTIAVMKLDFQEFYQ